MAVLGGGVRGSMSLWWMGFEVSDAQTRPIMVVIFLLPVDSDVESCLGRGVSSEQKALSKTMELKFFTEFKQPVLQETFG